MVVLVGKPSHNNNNNNIGQTNARGPTVFIQKTVIYCPDFETWNVNLFVTSDLVLT